PTLCRDFALTEPADWFETGTITADGGVKPADSLNFTAGDECDYYKWAARMFLWLTSPAPGGGRTFESPEFYSVSALTGDKRTLERNTGGKVGEGKRDIFSVRVPKPVSESGQPETGGVLMARNNSPVL